jgi:predicted dehydrogenase
MDKIRLAQIGLGRWGPNLFRNFYDNPDVSFELVCDKQSDKKQKIEKFGVPFTVDSDEILKNDNGIDAVVIATPLETHYELAKRAIEVGKHVFIEKPIASTLAESKELAQLAKEKQVILMVGHVFLFNAGIRYVKQLISSRELGNVLYVYGQRTNLGPIRNDTNALWDLASHDISIFNYWLDAEPIEVTSSGSSILNEAHEDIVSSVFYYPGNISCQILASWLHPQKIRQITVVGEKKMAIWDDMDSTSPVKIYNKSVTRIEPKEQTEGTLSEFNFLIQEGEVNMPEIQLCEPLKAECQHFIESVMSNTQPMTDANNGVAVVAALEASDKSLRNGSLRTSLYE